MMSSVLARIRCESEVAAPLTRSPSVANFLIPEPLRSYVGGDVHDLNWMRMAPRVHQIQINTPNSRSQARLLRFQSGTSVPAHGHRGRELTLVLTGSLCDRDTILYRGDIAETDERTEHQPYAGPDEDCICLAVTDAPLRFKSMFARSAAAAVRDLAIDMQHVVRIFGRISSCSVIDCLYRHGDGISGRRSPVAQPNDDVSTGPDWGLVGRQTEYSGGCGVLRHLYRWSRRFCRHAVGKERFLDLRRAAGRPFGIGGVRNL